MYDKKDREDSSTVRSRDQALAKLRVSRDGYMEERAIDRIMMHPGTAKAFESASHSRMTLATAHDSVSLVKHSDISLSTEYITRPERQAHFVLFGKSANRPADGRGRRRSDSLSSPSSQKS